MSNVNRSLNNSGEDEEHVFALKEKDRVGFVGLVWVGVLSVAGVTIFAVFKLAIRVRTGEGTMSIPDGILFVAVCLPLCWHFARLVLSSGREFEWFSAKFTVSKRGIERVLRSGARRYGAWADLRYVSPQKRMLYFEDGTIIPLKYGEIGQAVLSKCDLATVMATAGEDSLLTKALGSYDAAVPTAKRKNIVGGIFYVPLWAALLLVMRFAPPDHSFRVQLITGITIVWSVVLLGGYYLMVKKSLAIEKKYRPPRKRTSR